MSEATLFEKFYDRRRVPDSAERYRLRPAFAAILAARLDGFEEDNREAGPDRCVLRYRWTGEKHGACLVVDTEHRPQVTAIFKKRRVVLSEATYDWPTILKALADGGEDLPCPKRHAKKKERQ